MSHRAIRARRNMPTRVAVAAAFLGTLAGGFIIGQTGDRSPEAAQRQQDARGASVPPSVSAPIVAGDLVMGDKIVSTPKPIVSRPATKPAAPIVSRPATKPAPVKVAPVAAKPAPVKVAPKPTTKPAPEPLYWDSHDAPNGGTWAKDATAEEKCELKWHSDPASGLSYYGPEVDGRDTYVVHEDDDVTGEPNPHTHCGNAY
jgi:hypothetical protein